jgi:zinc/manganese transport system substrate-binding protein
MHRRSFLAFAAAMLASPAARAQARDDVVASMSIIADLVGIVGGERVGVASLVERGGDAHVYQPSPADARRVAQARALFVNGLGLEGWLPRLVQASGGKARIVTVSKGVQPIREAGAEIDPHAWQDVANAKIYVANIRDALSDADPAGRDLYAQRAADYLRELDALDADIRAGVASIPAARRKIITSHDAFGYFAKAYGLTFIAPQGVSTEAEASSRDVARIIRQIKAEKIPAVFLENISDPRLMNQVARETGAKVGERVFSDSLSDANGPAPTYLAMMRHNLSAFTQALR